MLSLHHLKKNTKQLFGSVIVMVLFFFLAHPDTSAEVRLTTSPYTVEMGGKVEEQDRGKYTLNQGNQTHIEIWIFKKNKIKGRDEQAVCAKIITSLEDVQDLQKIHQGLKTASQSVFFLKKQLKMKLH